MWLCDVQFTTYKLSQHDATRKNNFLKYEAMVKGGVGLLRRDCMQWRHTGANGREMVGNPWDYVAAGWLIPVYDLAIIDFDNDGSFQIVSMYL